MSVPRGSVTDATAKLNQRRRQRRRTGVVLTAWLVGVTLLLSGVAYLVFGSPAFVARTVRVDGVKLLTVEQVRAQAAVPRVPLARLNTAAISDRVGALPEVGSVRVRVRLPSTVVIEVIERSAAVQRIEGTQFQWADAQGIVFHESSKKLANVLAVKTPGTDQRLLRDAATIAKNLTPTLRTRARHLEATSPDAFVLVLDSGQKVIWGSADDSLTKAQVATAMLAVKASVFDVSSPSTPTSR